MFNFRLDINVEIGSLILSQISFTPMPHFPGFKTEITKLITTTTSYMFTATDTIHKHPAFRASFPVNELFLKINVAGSFVVRKLAFFAKSHST